MSSRSILFGKKFKTPLCKIGELVGKQEGMLDKIQFHNIHHKSILSDLYADKVGHHNNNSCKSDNNWKDKKNPEVDLKNLVANVGINDNEVDDLDVKDALHLNDGFAGIKDTEMTEFNMNRIKQHHFGGPIEYEGE